MTQEHQAADALRKFARMLEPVSEAIEVLDRIGSYRQAEDEALVAAQDAGHKRDAVKQELADLQQQHEQLVTQHKQAIEQVQAHANKIIAEAEAEGTARVESARREAESLMAEAKLAAAAMRADGMRDRDSAIVATNVANGELEKALKELASVKEQLEAFRKKFSDERARVAAALGIDPS